MDDVWEMPVKIWSRINKEEDLVQFKVTIWTLEYVQKNPSRFKNILKKKPITQTADKHPDIGTSLRMFYFMEIYVIFHYKINV